MLASLTHEIYAGSCTFSSPHSEHAFVEKVHYSPFRVAQSSHIPHTSSHETCSTLLDQVLLSILVYHTDGKGLIVALWLWVFLVSEHIQMHAKSTYLNFSVATEAPHWLLGFGKPSIDISHAGTGHAKSICLNFGVAKEFGGVTNMRFDDTNPVRTQSCTTSLWHRIPKKSRAAKRLSAVFFQHQLVPGWKPYIPKCICTCVYVCMCESVGFFACNHLTEYW